MAGRYLVSVLVAIGFIFLSLPFAQAQAPTPEATSKGPFPVTMGGFISKTHEVVVDGTCDSPPCVGPARASTEGFKTAVVDLESGTMTYRTRCYPVRGVDAFEEICGAGSDQTDDSVCTTSTWCDEVKIHITACSSCLFSMYLRQDKR